MTAIIREPINCDYEYIQYNKKLRIIHSIDDDMYQVQSIINACHSNKRANEWYRNQETKALLKAFDNDRELMGFISCTNKYYLPNNLKGLYVHRLLVNAVAMWTSPVYALQIYKLLDEMASAERKAMEAKLEQSESTIQHQRPRMVPKNHEHDYKYLIWKEPHPQYPKSVILHLVRRNNSTFKQIQEHFENDDERWFYMDNLPISMSVNKDIIDIIKTIVPAGEYSIKNCDVTVGNRYLSKLHDSISEYFKAFQK